MKNLDYNEGGSNPETMSSKKLKMWLPVDPPNTNGEYIGELIIENGQFVATGETKEDTQWLYQQLQQIWSPQLGVPVWKKEGDEFAVDKDGKYIIDKYVHHANCEADELLEAVFDYIRSMGVFKVELADK